MRSRYIGTVSLTTPSRHRARPPPTVPAVTAPARPTLSVGIPTFGTRPDDGWRHLLDVARAADDAGIDRLVISDHVVLGPRTADYPWGTFPTGPEADWLEPLTLMAALAAVTTRVRFLTGVLVAPLRPAALLAKTVATLDVLSGGRVDLGVGTGWQPEEFTALGVPFADRGALLTAAVEQCRALWTGRPVPVTGAEGETTEVWCAPVPVQDPLPVWFSGTLTTRNVDRIVRLGDGWIPIMGTDVDGLRAGTERLADAARAAGRDPAHIAVRASLPTVRGADGRADLAATIDAAPALVAAGATDLHVSLRALDPEGTRTAATFATLAARFAAATA